MREYSGWNCCRFDNPFRRFENSGYARSSSAYYNPCRYISFTGWFQYRIVQKRKFLRCSVDLKQYTRQKVLKRFFLALFHERCGSQRAVLYSLVCTNGLYMDWWIYRAYSLFRGFNSKFFAPARCISFVCLHIQTPDVMSSGIFINRNVG